MVTNEQYFPRGGTKPKASFTDKKNFDFLGNADRIGRKRRYKTPKHLYADQEQEDEDGGHLSDVSVDSDKGIKSISAEAISNYTLQEGMIVVGRVVIIYDTKILVSLPGKICGILMACHIGNSYTKLLQAFVDDKINDMKKLEDIFKVGEYITVSVLSVTEVEKDKPLVALSMMPQDVNKGITFSNLKEGQLLRGSVDSVEDHGYVIDLGIANCRTFLPSKLTEENLSLAMGQIIWCLVKKCQKSPTNSIVTVTNQLQYIKSACVAGALSHKYSATDLRPGMSTSFFVSKPLIDGVEGNVLSNSLGYIHVTQMASRLKPGQTVNARLLYTMPITKFLFLTTREIFDSFDPDIVQEAPVKIGKIIEDAKLSKVTNKFIIFKFDNETAIMPRKHLSESDSQNVQDLYPSGSRHTIRITHYLPSDYIYQCSDQQEILQRKFFNMSDIKVGQIVEAVVKNANDKGVEVMVEKIKGWIPNNHVSDVALYVPARPDQKATSLAVKKFKPGQVIQVRVLTVNKVSLLLTAKQSLVDENTYALTKFEDAKVGYQYKGIIHKIQPNHVLVSFFGGVCAFVGKNNVSHDRNINIPAAFNIGQIVNCTIISTKPEEFKIYGSLIKPGTVEQATTSKIKKIKKRKHSEREDDEVAEVKIKKSKDSNLLEEKQSQELKKKNKNKEENGAFSVEDNAVEDVVDNKSKKKKQNEIADDVVLHVKVKKSKKDKKDDGLDIGAEKVLDSSEKKSKKNNEKKEEVIVETNISKKAKKKQLKEDNLNEKTQDVSMIDDVDQEVSKKKKKSMKSDLLPEVAIPVQNEKKKKNKSAKAEEEAEILKSEKNNKKQKHSAEDAAETVQSKKKRKNSEQEVEKTEEACKKDKKKDKKDKKKNERNLKNGTETVEKDVKFPSMSNFWALDSAALSKNLRKDDQSSSDSEEEKVDDQTKKKKKRLTTAEKVEKARSEEEKLRNIERELAASDSQPQSSDHFDRLLLANPNSSELWIAYMAFNLQATEIERARAIGRKAISTISFREEQDKLNVWLAMLNLENRFGTKESLSVTLQEALQMNEPFKVHSKMLEMYADTGKVQELTELIDKMMAKYRHTPETYTAAGEACYNLNIVEKARSVMQKAVNRLDNKTHVPVLIKFAQMENSRGDSERAEAIFEQIVGCMPQRVDVWSVYVDMLSKSNKMDSARLVMERAVSQKLPARKMKTLYKKWMEIEEKQGNTEEVERVRQMALEYVEKAKS